jgi:hypothetical protein
MFVEVTVDVHKVVVKTILPKQNLMPGLKKQVFQ